MRAVPVTEVATGAIARLTSAAHEGDASYALNLLAGASDADDGETATLSVASVSYAVDGGLASATAPAGVSLAGHTLSVDPTNAAFRSEERRVGKKRRAG